MHSIKRLDTLSNHLKEIKKIINKKEFVKVKAKKVSIRCPYTYKSFERCPSCFTYTDGAKVCYKCNKDVKESYMQNVKDGKFA